MIRLPAIANRRRPGGFSLLEVLIALLIFSVGLLGMAGLMIVAVKTNQSAYLRTQASFMAQGMADRIRANKSALATNAYNGSYAAASTAETDPCAGGVPCSVANVVTRDQQIFRRLLGDLLPVASAEIDCDGKLIGSASQVGASAYDGLCSLTIAWSESSLERGGSGDPVAQTFAWVFQP